MSLNVMDTFDRLSVLPKDVRDSELASLSTLSPVDAERLRKMLFVYDATVPNNADALPYAQLGVWRLHKRIATGGSGIIYSVTRNDDVHQEPAALKIVKHADESDNNLFALERRRLAKLNHPYIARLIDGGKAPDNALFMVVEYLSGTDPVTYCEANRLSTRERLKLFLRMCDALAYLHSFGLIHRDIKPGNMIVAQDGAFKLLDFGISTEHGSADSHEAGTPAYAAPEVWQQAVPSVRQDVYSLGLVLYSLWAGTTLGARESNLGLLTKIMFAETVLTSEMLQACPKELAAVIKKACALDPNQRYPSVLAMRQDIEALLDRRPVSGYGGLPYRLQCFVRRNPWISALAVTTCGLVGVALMLGQQAMIERDQLSRSEQRMTITQRYLSQVFRNALFDGRILAADEALANTLAEILQKLPHDPERLLPVVVEMGRLYQEMNKPKQAVEVFEQAQASAMQTSDYARAWFDFAFAEALNGMNRDEEALVALKSAETFFNKQKHAYHYEYFRVRKLNHHLSVVKTAKDAAAREVVITGLTELITEALEQYPNDTGVLANLYGSLAKAYIVNEHWEKGENHAQRALELMRADGLEKSSVYFATQNLLAYVMNATNRPTDAMRLLEQVVSARRERLGASLFGVAEMSGLINLKLDAGDVEQAKQLADRALNDMQQLGLAEHQVAFGLEVQQCEVNVSLGLQTTACFAELFDKAVASPSESEAKKKIALQSAYFFFTSRNDAEGANAVLEKAKQQVSEGFAERLASF